MFLCLFAGPGPLEMLAGFKIVIKVKNVLSSFSCRPWSNSFIRVNYLSTVCKNFKRESIEKSKI